MRLARVFIHRLRSLFWRSRADRELQRELALHIEQLTREAVSRGMSEEEARKFASREFGSLARTTEECRDMRRINMVGNFVQDAWYGARALVKNPGFTIVAVLTLALGIGANSAIFSVINAAIVRPLPYPHPGQLILLFEKDLMGPGGGPNVVSLANFKDWERDSKSFAAMAAGRENSFDVGGSTATTPEHIDGAIFSWALFKTLDVQPVLGRTFTQSDDSPGAQRVAIISYALWQHRFGGAQDILTRNIRLDGFSYQIIGVMPQAFAYPARDVQLWVPVEQILTGEDLHSRENHELYVVGRVRRGVGIARATAEVDAIQRRIKASNPGAIVGRDAVSLPLRDITTIQSKTSLYVLLGAVACLLLIACVNVSNLLLARGSSRSREFAIRTALGASRIRLLQQALTESVLLASIGAVAGLLLAFGLTHALAAHANVLIQADDIDTSATVAIDARVLGFTAAISLLVGILSGFLSAGRGPDTNAGHVLKEGSLTVIGSRTREKLRAGLVSSEFALSVLLLIAAVLMIRSFIALQNVQPGVRVGNVLTAGVSLPEAQYRNREQISNFARDLETRFEVLPGVVNAGLVNCLPVGGYCGDNSFKIVGRPLPPGKFYLALNRAASPQYFRAAGIPFLQGTTFTDWDGRGFDDDHPHESSVVISESMAKQFWPRGDALGQQIYFEDGPRAARYRVVGIVGDVLINLADHARPTMYLPLFEGDRTTFYTVLHTEGDPRAVSATLRRTMKALDPDVPVFKIRTMRDVLGQSAEQRAFTAALFGSLAALALILSAIGLYGVLAYLVTQRVPEIGIRMALGASRFDVLGLFLLQGLRPALAGLGLGLLLAVVVGRIFRTLLFGVAGTNAITLVSVSLGLLLVAVLACTLPAWRAARLQPAIALRNE